MATRNRATQGIPTRPRRAAPAGLLLELLDRLAALDTLDEQLAVLIATTTEATGADRGTIFLLDDATGELYAWVSQGGRVPEIRSARDVGIIGHVFTTGEGVLIPDAPADPRFNPAIDEKTGYKTRNVLCVPVRTRRGELLGVAQVLNKKAGPFTRRDLAVLQSIVQQASIILHGSLTVAKMLDSQRKEADFLNVVAEISSEIQIGRLLRMIISIVTKILDAERSTLFLNDEKSGELYTEVGEGIGASQIRFPNTVGIAGSVFQTGRAINLPYAYADLRFNPAFDRRTGFFTRSLLCVPVSTKEGRIIGVTQVLNKAGGPFNHDDEVRLKAFTAQIAIALENAKLFDEVRSIKNYNERILESMPSGLLTFDAEGRIVTCNQAGLRLLSVAPGEILDKPAAEFFGGHNAWVLDSLRRADAQGAAAITMDAELEVGPGRRSVNLTAMPLTGGKGESLGSMMLIEDISGEKRLHATLARYMDPGLADRILGAGEEILGGQTSVATVLFADIRGFTGLSEELGPQGTVALLNDYFTMMVECIQREGGMLDKFIGDAIMAIFGTPLAHDDDPDRGVRAAIAMMRALREFNEARGTRGLKPIRIGIGLNTDQIVSGNIGSPKRMDYTVIGDGVNLASRLEASCKQYGAQILVSQYTLDRVRGTYRTREIDVVIVKGRSESVRIHEVLDFHTEETFPEMMAVLGCFRDGLELYRAGAWDRAAKVFRQALRHHPRDLPSEMYADRCDYLNRNPPEGWDGVWRMAHK